jgi:hypothetical protein
MFCSMHKLELRMPFRQLRKGLQLGRTLFRVGYAKANRVRSIQSRAGASLGFDGAPKSLESVYVGTHSVNLLLLFLAEATLR